MRLLDQIVQNAGPVCLSRDPVLVLPGAERLAPLLTQCPLRYVLTDEAALFAAQLAFEPASVLDECLDILRAPAASVWVEYDQRARHSLFSALHLGPAHEPRAQRIGLLARMHDAGMRRGEISIAWEGKGNAPPELSPIIAEFDLDNPHFASETPLAALACRASCLSVRGLLNRIRLSLEPCWHDYYRQRLGKTEFDAAMLRNAEYAFGDAPMIFAVFLLAMSGRALVLRASNLERLNRSRSKAGRPALLDHTEVSINLLGDRNVGQGGGPGHARQAPRLHHVRGHLVRRGNGVFWRSPHLRGSAQLGKIQHRTVTLGASQITRRHR